MEKILENGYFQSVAKSDNLNVVEKGGMLLLGGIIKGFVEPVMTGIKVVKDKTGIDIEKTIIESKEKEEEERENYPAKWAMKKLAKGTAKGVLAGMGITPFIEESSE